MLLQLQALPKGEYTVFTNKRNISKATGLKRCNIEQLKALGYSIKIKDGQCEGIKIVCADEI